MFVQREPPPSPRKRFSAVESRGENPIIVALQLIAIFALLRIVMLATGVTFATIPYVDRWLHEVVKVLIRYMG